MGIFQKWRPVPQAGGVEAVLKQHVGEQLVAAAQIKVEEADLKAVAKEAIRAQFAQYGMSNVPDDVLENYAADGCRWGSR